MLTQGMRQMAGLELGDIRQGLAGLTNPDAGFLDMLGRTREERVEKMAALLRNSAEADIEELGLVFGLAMAKVGDQPDRPPGGRRRDPVAGLVVGMRRISRMSLADIQRGLENMSRPSAGGLLDSLGRTRRQRVAKMAAMLANSSEADLEEMGAIYALAFARAAAEESPDTGRDASRPRRRRGQTSAEWRRERR